MIRYGAFIVWDEDGHRWAHAHVRRYRVPHPEWFSVAGRLRAMRLRRKGVGK